MDNVCKICGGTIEDIETENGNIVRICVCCEFPYDCKEKGDVEYENNKKIS